MNIEKLSLLFSVLAVLVPVFLFFFEKRGRFEIYYEYNAMENMANFNIIGGYRMEKFYLENTGKEPVKVIGVIYRTKESKAKFPITLYPKQRSVVYEMESFSVFLEKDRPAFVVSYKFLGLFPVHILFYSYKKIT